jgi:hypothetical protein
MFTCKSALWREDTILEDPRLELTSCDIGYDLIEYGKADRVNDLLDPESSDQDLRSGKSLDNQRTKSSGPIEEYQLALSEFTKRDLRYETDMLRASAGVLNRIGASMGVHMLYGLPEELLDMSLLWYPSRPTVRRNLFPSWTWAEWRGTPLLPLRFPRTGDLKWWQSTNTWIEWLKFDGTPFRELEKTEFYQQGEFHKRKPPDIPVETFPRVPLPTDSTPLNKLDHQALLRFWTIFVKLRVEVDVIPYGGMRCFDLSDGEGNFAGRAIIHDTCWEAQLPSVAELVILSQVLTFSESEPPNWGDDSFGYLGLGTAKYVYPKEDIIKRATAPVDYYPEEDYRRTDRFLNVLMISWNKLGVAERIGVGKVFRSAVKISLAPGPVWKEVLLG